MEPSSRMVVGGSLAAAGLLAVVASWLVLENRARSRENERLHADLERARARPVPPPPRQPEPPPPAAPPVPDPPVPKPPPPEPWADLLQTLRARGETKPEEVAALQAKARDPAAAPQERLDALAKLRFAGREARSPEVVRSMMDLVRTSPDAAVRADIFRQLKGVESDELKGQLLMSVRADPAPKAREEAAETLGPMKADPVVRQALEQVAASDPDEDVKAQARKSLAGRR